MIAANSITADKLSASTIELTENQGIKGGGATLDANGLTDANNQISGLSSQIKQNADSITSVVTNLSDSEKAKNNYSAIAQLDDDVNLRVSKDDVINQINISKESILIDGKKVHITGDTKFDNNVIVGGMIAANSITADKLTVGSVTEQAIGDGAISAKKIKVDSLSSVCATIGTLQTATSGARTVIKDNLIAVYDSNNVCRVKLGVW